ncbi:FG-GAP-like repeat-containing protein [Arenibacter sp. N53]|nr:FG-GAP-like repeat-containing protein [Arenibacter sp. N53]
MMKKCLLIPCFVILIFKGTEKIYAQSFKEVSGDAGITHHFFNVNQEGGSVAFFDFNNDGWDDLYVTGGGLPDKLFENLGNGDFKDVSKALGIDQVANIDTMGAYAADLDNDGYSDIFISTKMDDTCYVLWNNHGNSFEIANTTSGLSDTFYGTSIAVGDYDLDGDLDVYVGNYRAITQDVFYKNNGHRTFSNISSQIVGDDGKGATWAVAFSDWDRDNDPDLFVVNDFGNIILPNKLFQNDYPNNSFTEISATVGYNEAMDGMSIGIGDFDEDGDMDYYSSDTGPNNFFVNENDSFVDRAMELGITVDDGTSWGSVFTDYNNDTYLDLLVMNGPIGLSDGHEHKNKLFRGNGAAFQDVSEAEGVASVYNSRGLTLSDFDNDGRVDYAAAVLDIERETPRHMLLYKNVNNSNANWIQVELQGTSNNKDGYGSFIEIEVSGRTFSKEQYGGGSFMSTQSKTQHFGLGDYTRVDKLNVIWPGGNTTTFNNLSVKKRFRVVENGELFVLEPNKVSLKQGETAFLEGESQNVPGIYRDTLATNPYRTIRITKLDFNGETSGGESTGGEANGLSVARRWNELLLESIRNDYARPTVHARNLFHTSIAMYDAFTVFNNEAKPYFLGNKIGNYQVDFSGITIPGNEEAAQKEAMSYACFRLLNHRFKDAPGSIRLLQSYKALMQELGYDFNFTSTNYSEGSPAALGNYLGEQLIAFGLQDGSNEINQYANKYYQPKNDPLVVNEPGNPTITYPNNWQPLALTNFIDQSGNVIGASTPEFLSPEWGRVVPYALKRDELTIKNKDGQEYWLYHNPEGPAEIKSDGTLGMADPYKWNFSLVSVWSSHLNPSDGTMIDISPASIGNIDLASFPKTFEEYKEFYNLTEGGDVGKGHKINPVTNAPYEPQMVLKGDYTRVLAEFWADGPNSETPPGHWFTILNYVSDHPMTEKKFNGKGEVLSNLEWDVKSYMVLAGAMHDAAITAWGLKGYYDNIRPISAIRYMASKGQSSDRSLPSYHTEGIPLLSGFIQVVQKDDVLAGINNENVGKIKLYAWKGSNLIENPDTDIAGVGWILAENWVPYQRPSFVTPPFGGYISGHSTFSRAGAEVLTELTGSKFFPGGMGTFSMEKNKFLVFEDGPSADLTLQWATYQDASDQCSLSRIWGGIHPPMDDIVGRIAGEEIGKEAFSQSKYFFYEDKDGDGYLSFEDVDDTNNNIHSKIDQSQKLVYRLFPVPVKDELTLSIDDFKGRLNFSAFSMYGTKVLDKEIDVAQGEVIIPLQQLASGVFILVFTNDNNEKLIAQKIIKL